MLKRLFKCLKGWGACIFVLMVPVLFLYPEFHFGNERWKIVLSVFYVFFPTFLLFEFTFKNYLPKARWIQTGLFSLLFLLSEIELFLLPVEYTQIQFLGTWYSEIAFVVFTIPAGFVAKRIIDPTKNLVIVQKEI